MTHIFKRKTENGIEEEIVELERWVWGVVYKDGTELHQFDSEGIFHQFKEIQLDKVKLLSMYKPDDMSKRYDLVVTEGMQLFHFYRNTKPYYLDHYVRTYVFGWKSFKTQNGFEIHTPKGEDKDGVASYHFILPDDRMVMSDINNVDLPQFNLK